MANLPGAITVILSASSGATRVKLTTWGTVQGRYQSLGSVSLPAPLTFDPDSVQDVARVLLTALYGLDYDL